MANQPLRFIHASDLHLGRAMRGLAEVPEHLRDALVDVTYTAATRVFDAAINQQTDFLVLAGDIYSADESGPRGYAFLEEQFQRLGRQNIPVYWCGGRMEYAAEQSTPAWPKNVTVFSAERMDAVRHHKNGEPAARIVGIGYRPKHRLMARDFSMVDEHLPNIAVSYGRFDADDLSDTPIGYWALGGEHEQQTLHAAREVAHYCGAAQGLSAASPGAHGCALVEWNIGGPPRFSALPTDAVRWRHERLVLEPGSSHEDLQNKLRERTRSLADHSAGVHLLVSWSLAGSAAVVKELRQGACDDLINGLRSEFGWQSPAVWTVNLEADSHVELPTTWYDEETILGDFLRTVHDFEVEKTAIDFASLLSEKHGAGELADLVQLGPAQRERVLRQATLLGVELLRGEEPNV